MIYDMCARIATPIKSVDQIVFLIDDYFGRSENIVVECKNGTTFLKNLSNENLIEVYLSKNSDGLVYESSILGSDFEYEYLIGFDVSKEADSIEKCYKKALDCIKYIVDQTQYEVLVTFDFEFDICYYSSSGNVRWNHTQEKRFK